MAPSIAQIPITSRVPPTKFSQPHPYAPLSAEEIKYASSLLRTQWPDSTDLQFKIVTLDEPPKREVLSYLDAEAHNDYLPAIARKAFINYYLRKTNKFHEAVVNLSEGRVERNVRLGKNVHGGGDVEEIVAMERIALQDEAVKREIERLKLPENAVIVCDPWIYGMLAIVQCLRLAQRYAK